MNFANDESMFNVNIERFETDLLLIYQSRPGTV